MTDDLGASHRRIFAGKLPQGSSLNDAIGWTVETMKAACDYSGEKGIVLGLEDHDGVTPRTATQHFWSHNRHVDRKRVHKARI